MAALDLTLTYPGNLSDPVGMLASVTPNDGTDLPFVSTAIYVGVAGNVVLSPYKQNAMAPGGQSGGVTQAGNVTMALTTGWHPIRATRILATGTTATGIFIGTVAGG